MPFKIKDELRITTNEYLSAIKDEKEAFDAVKIRDPRGVYNSQAHPESRLFRFLQETIKNDFFQMVEGLSFSQVEEIVSVISHGLISHKAQQTFTNKK